MLKFLARHLPRIFRERTEQGFTFIELLVVIGIIATLMVLTIPAFANLLEKNRVNQATSDIALISQKIEDHIDDFGSPPNSLSDLDIVMTKDPWGNPYAYFPIFGKDKSAVRGKWRMDRFLVPLNTDFDLYSMGKDGESIAPLTAKQSHDDVIRANNGDYIGLAVKY